MCAICIRSKSNYFSIYFCSSFLFSIWKRSIIIRNRPQLSDLRESGAIEQDADMVCFIHRPEYYRIFNDDKTGKDLRGLGQIIVAKHRNGATDEVWMRFIGKYAKFQNESDDFDQSIYDTPAESSSTNTTFQSRMNSLSEADGAKLDDDITPF